MITLHILAHSFRTSSFFFSDALFLWSLATCLLIISSMPFDPLHVIFEYRDPLTFSMPIVEIPYHPFNQLPKKLKKDIRFSSSEFPRHEENPPHVMLSSSSLSPGPHPTFLFRITFNLTFNTFNVFLHCLKFFCEKRRCYFFPTLSLSNTPQSSYYDRAFLGNDFRSGLDPRHLRFGVFLERLHEPRAHLS